MIISVVNISLKRSWPSKLFPMYKKYSLITTGFFMGSLILGFLLHFATFKI